MIALHEVDKVPLGPFCLRVTLFSWLFLSQVYASFFLLIIFSPSSFPLDSLTLVDPVLRDSTISVSPLQ